MSGARPPRRAAVLGSPIGHSLSPVLHRTAYAGLGLDWRYDAVDCDEHRIGPFLAALDDNWVGLSLTMPCKAAGLELADTASDLALAVGAANTLVPGPHGWHADNTDVAGIIAALAGIGAPAADTLILGAGGTARAALAACSELGVTRVAVAARRAEAGAELVEVGQALGVAVTVLPWPGDPLPGSDRFPVVISTVPADATLGLVDLVPAAPGWLLDVTYHPWPSRLAQAWVAAGGTAVGGATMLVAQAAAQVRLFTGRQPDVAAMTEALSVALAGRQHSAT